jgi:hypothetical protein
LKGVIVYIKSFQGTIFQAVYIPDARSRLIHVDKGCEVIIKPEIVNHFANRVYLRLEEVFSLSEHSSRIYLFLYLTEIRSAAFAIMRLFPSRQVSSSILLQQALRQQPSVPPFQ